MSAAELSAAVLTVSDRSHRGDRADRSGPDLVEAVRAAGFRVGEARVVPDEKVEIEMELIRLADEEHVALILTTGGTGFAPRDVTPEATRAVIQREAPGLAEHARAATRSSSRFSILSRGVAGLRGRSLIVNLPGSPKGAVETFQVLAPVLPHALAVLVRAADEHPEA